LQLFSAPGIKILSIPDFVNEMIYDAVVFPEHDNNQEKNTAGVYPMIKHVKKFQASHTCQSA
jgi:mitochondrial fission protein ELM1